MRSFREDVVFAGKLVLYGIDAVESLGLTLTCSAQHASSGYIRVAEWNEAWTEPWV